MRHLFPYFYQFSFFQGFSCPLLILLFHYSCDKTFYLLSSCSPLTGPSRLVRLWITVSLNFPFQAIPHSTKGDVLDPLRLDTFRGGLTSNSHLPFRSLSLPFRELHRQSESLKDGIKDLVSVGDGPIRGLETRTFKIPWRLETLWSELVPLPPPLHGNFV